MSAIPVPRFDQFYRHEELTRLLHGFARDPPDLCSVASIGRSHEGRDLWLVTVTSAKTGPADEKPAFWVDGNIHAAELTASTACLYWLHWLLTHYGGDGDAGRQATALLDTRAVYLVPRLNPDGAELALADKPRHIRSSTRPYPFDEAPVDGLTVEDVDGDGRALQMRIADPHGGWKKHPREPLLVPREPGDFGGAYFRVMPEGLLTNFDGLQIQVNPNREGLDLNRNFPAYWRQEFEQPGAGPYPASEPEVRAMVEFIVQHPNIGAAVSFHTHSGVILRPMGTQSDDDMTPEDLWIYKRLSDLGAKLSGYPAISIFHDFKYHPPEDDLKLLKWSDEQCGGRAHVAWYPFQHPQLGAVELGGWDKMNYWRNPPPHLREREVARFPGWLARIALSLPKLEVLRTEVRALGEDCWRVRFAVANAGYLPAYVSKRALERKVARGVVFHIHLPLGASLVGGAPRIVGPQLEGHAPKTSMQAFVPNPGITADRAVAEWIVRGPRGARIGLSAVADRAGAVRAEVTLD